MPDKIFFPSRRYLPAKSYVEEKSAAKLFWKSFKHNNEISGSSAVYSVNFSPKTPNNLALSSSTQVELWETSTYARIQSYSKSKDVLYCITYRADGKLLSTGNASGEIMIYDVESKLLLRTLTGHFGAVRSVKFLHQTGYLVSTSDDKTVRLWSITEGHEIYRFSNHSDYVRSLSTCDSSIDLFATGSYDGTICLFSVDSRNCILSLNHGAAVEDIKFFGSLVISCGGNFVRIWDISAGGKLVQTIECHQKTVSCINITLDKRFLITGSLDRQVKVIDLVTYEIVGAYKYEAAVMSLAINNNGTQIAVGLSNGKVAIKTRKNKNPFMVNRDSNTFPIVSSNVKESKSTQFDFALKRFKYATALDIAIKDNTNDSLIKAILELNRRRGLRASVEARDAGWVYGVLDIVLKSLRNPDSFGTMILLFKEILDCHNDKLLSNEANISLLVKIRNTIYEELSLQNQSLITLGSISSLII